MSKECVTKIIRESDSKEFFLLSGHRCKKCGVVLREDGYETCYPCGFNKQLQYLYEGIFFGYYDQGHWSTLLSKELLNFKTDSNYAGGLAELLEFAYKPKNISLDLLVPVPPRKDRDTDFNPPTLLAQKFGERIGIESIEVLYFNRITKKMTDLESKEDRKKNIEGAISLLPEVNLVGKVIGIVDDIFTEGSTINECAKILKNAGVKYVYGICVGRSVPGYEKEYIC